MTIITANELKTKGVASLEQALQEQDEAVISVRGKPRYVVMDLERYERLRGAEVFSAWQEAREALAKGDYVTEQADEHIVRLRQELAPDAL